MGITRILHAAGNYRGTLPLAAHPDVDAIEADVWLRAGKVFVNHARPLGPLPYTIGIDGIRREERDCVDVAQLIEAVDGCAQLVLDLRSWVGDPAPDLVRVLDPVPDSSHLVVTCESWPIADRLRAWLPELRVFYSVRSEGQLRRYVQGRIGGGLPQTPVTVHHKLLRSPAEAASLQRWAGVVWVWTVDEEARAQELREWGVHGVTSNRVEVLSALS